MIDLSRAFAEKRRLILPIAIAAGASTSRSTPSSSTRGRRRRARSSSAAQQAAMARARATADLRDAEAMRTGQERAAQQLTRFYDSVLPRGRKARGGSRIAGWRHWPTNRTSTTTAARSSTKEDAQSALEQMDVTMVLEGEYRDVRRFIHKLETAPEFVVIEDVGLVQGEKNAPLTLTVKLSTYYKAGS